MIGWDGSNLVIRLPKDIASYLNVTKENRFKKSIKFIIKAKDEEVEKRFDIIERTKPKRIFKKKNAKKEK